MREKAWRMLWSQNSFKTLTLNSDAMSYLRYCSEVQYQARRWNLPPKLLRQPQPASSFVKDACSVASMFVIKAPVAALPWSCLQTAQKCLRCQIGRTAALLCMACQLGHNCARLAARARTLVSSSARAASVHHQMARCLLRKMKTGEFKKLQSKASIGVSLVRFDA